MAGSYPDVPDHRMAYDRDGTIGFYHPSGSTSPTTFSPTALVQLNDESDSFPLYWSQYYDGTYQVGVIFPELRDVTGILLGLFVDFASTGSGSMNGQVYTSTDTTNGVDGAWTSRGTGASLGLEVRDPTSVKYREDIASVSWSGVKAIRMHVSIGSIWADEIRVRALHIYGRPSTGEASTRLRFWHPTLDQEVDGAWFDWGDVGRSAVLYRDVRVKNPSGDTAVDVTLTMEALTDTSPTMQSQHAFSIGGGSYSSSLNIGDLAPGAVSGVVTVRREVPANAALSLWWSRIVASAATWT